MRAVAYIRVSTEEQVKNYSLQTQEKSIIDYCSGQDIELVRFFREEGEHAKTANRTELLKLITYCASRQNEIDVVIVTNFDRFARNAEDHLGVKATLLQVGVKLYSIQQPVDDTPAGRLAELFFAGFSQFDNEMRSLKSTQGMQRGLEMGRWTFGAAYGYNKAERKTSPSMFVVPNHSLRYFRP